MNKYDNINIKICELIWKIKVSQMFKHTLKMKETLLLFLSVVINGLKFIRTDIRSNISAWKVKVKGRGVAPQPK